jgi:hypothetical protein
MNKQLNRALTSVIYSTKTRGHSRKGRGKRISSKARRTVDKALCRAN